MPIKQEIADKSKHKTFVPEMTDYYVFVYPYFIFYVYRVR